MNNIKKLVKEIIKETYSDECFFTKQELENEYIEQIENNDAESLLVYLDVTKEIKLYHEVKSILI